MPRGGGPEDLDRRRAERGVEKTRFITIAKALRSRAWREQVIESVGLLPGPKLEDAYTVAWE
ncbi:hypothetical protein [Pyrobaculum calidifontis]|uniref:hypothetical protein n=1 Tax=Pyrobaculum calidifontis TaxID=181486 RepID=UPI000A76C42F|nr:hypothetical protein [Pyrobaculum calidifontis]